MEAGRSAWLNIASSTNFDSRHVCVKSFHLDNSDTVGHITRILAAKLQRCPTSFRTRIYRSLGDITFTLRYITSACTSSYFVSLLLHALFAFSNWKLEGYLVVSREREGKLFESLKKGIFWIKISLCDWWIRNSSFATRMTSGGYLSSYYRFFSAAH